MSSATSASPNYAKDVVPRTEGSILHLATFNVENLFSRPLAMLNDDFSKGQPYLDAFHALNTIFVKAEYDDQDKQTILELMQKHGLNVARPKNEYLEFRKIRGNMLSRSKGDVKVTARGRADWVGWIDLKRENIVDIAIANTVRVLAAVDADIFVLCEVEDRAGLERFSDSVLLPILRATGREPYRYSLIVDGNDKRGIDVGLLSRYPAAEISTHIFDVRNGKRIFYRDCCEYFVSVPGIPGRFVILANHFTSRGSDLTGLEKRIHQSQRVTEIVDE